MDLDYDKMNELIKVIKDSESALETIQQAAKKIAKSGSSMKIGISIAERTKEDDQPDCMRGNVDHRQIIFTANEMMGFGSPTKNPYDHLYKSLNGDKIEIEDPDMPNEIALIMLQAIQKHYSMLKSRAERELKLYLVQTKNINKRGYKLKFD